MSSCWDGIARLLLVVVNILFLVPAAFHKRSVEVSCCLCISIFFLFMTLMLTGLGITAVGFVLRYGKSLYEPFLETGMNQLQNALKATNLANFDVKSIDIGEVVMSLAIGLIIGGLILFGIAFLGCCGACCKVRFMLWLYAIVIIVFVVVEAVGIGLLYGKPDLVKDQLKDQLSEYESLASSEVFSLGWNIIMIQFKCCGVDSYVDFDSSKTKWNSPGSVGVTLATPIACCKDLPTGDQATDFDCAVKPSMALSNYETGCYSTIWDQSFGNTAIAVPVLVICGIIQILFIFFAIMVAKAENDKVRPV